jgi:hypothetical protein
VRHDFQILAPFKVVIGGVERSIIELSQQQHRVLDGMRRNRRFRENAASCRASEAACQSGPIDVAYLFQCFSSRLSARIGRVD